MPAVRRCVVRIACLSAVLACTWIGPTAGDGQAAESWPEFRGPAGNGHSDATGLPLTWSETENIRWKAPVHGRAWSSPVVWGNQIWLTTATPDGKKMSVVCLDLESGKIIHDRVLFENEKPRFCHKFNSYASCTPVIEEGRVYVHFGSYGTACLDTKTAKTLWSRRDLPCNHWRGPGSSPILYGDLLIVHFDGYDYQYLVAMDKSTGKTVWKQDRKHDYGTDNGDFKKAYSTPIIIEAAGRTQLISPCAKAVYSYNPLTGEEYWRVRFREHSATVRPLFSQGLLLVSTGFGKAQLLAIRADGGGDVTDTHIAWRTKKSVPSKPSMLVVDDLLYMVNDGGVASCLEVATGKPVWIERLGGNFTASPIYADGRLYFFSQEGKTTVVAPGRKFKKLATNQLDEGFMASPAVVGKSLILRTTKDVYRVEKQAAGEQ